jgi:iron complex transport system substrate-binding protein
MPPTLLATRNPHVCAPRTQDSDGEFHVVDATTRREFIGLLAAAGLLAACGSDNSTSAEGSSLRTRTIVDDAGREVDIPAQPQRVAVLHDEVAAHVVTLGYVPAGLAWAYDADFVATLQSFGGPTVDLDTITDLGSARPGEVNFERIATFEPDLILAVNNLTDDVAAFEAIAPTVFVDPRSNRNGEPFQKARFLAEIVGVDDRIDAKVTEYTEALASFRAAHGTELDGLDYVYWDTGFDGTVYSYDVDVFAINAVMNDLGIPMTPSVIDDADPESGYLEVSVERMTDYQAALIFLGRYDGQSTEDDVTTVLSNTFAAANDQVLDSRNANRWTFHLLQAQIDVLAELGQFFTKRTIQPMS